MTLSEFVEQNRSPFRQYASSWMDHYSRMVNEQIAYNADHGMEGDLTSDEYKEIRQRFDMEDKAFDVASKVLTAFGEKMRGQSMGEITAHDVDAISSLFPSGWGDEVKAGVYKKTKEMIHVWQWSFNGSEYVSPDASFLNGLLNHETFLDRWTLDAIKKNKKPESIIDNVMNSKNENVQGNKGKLLENLVENPLVNNKQAIGILNHIANEPNVKNFSVALHAIERKIGQEAFDAELDKMPADAPIFYVTSVRTDLSRRSAEEIQQHINTGSSFDDPDVNNTVLNSPNFSVDHLRSWPKDLGLDNDAIEKIIENPKLSATMKHDELLPLVKTLANPNIDRWEARQLYSHMIDMSSTDGRPKDIDIETYRDKWFGNLSRNPTFIANTTDLDNMSDGEHYGMFGPERMSPDLKKYFEDIKPVLDDLSNYSFDDVAIDRLRDITNKTGFRKYGDFRWHDLFPILSHYDPEYVASWVNKATGQSFDFLNNSLRGNDNIAKIHPSALNGMDVEKLYYFTQEHRIPLSKLSQETQKGLAEHFKSTIPDMSSDSFEHFHRNGNTYDMSMAGEFSALDEYLQHAAKDLGHQTLQVKRGSGTLRALRDFLEGKYRDTGVSSVNPRDLPKDRTWNSVYQTLVTRNKDGSTTESKTIDWNPLRGKNGNVSAETVQAYIDRMKPIGVNVTETGWSGPQRHNQKNSKVVVFGMTNDHIDRLKNAGLWEDFKRVSADLPRGHPQHPFALGWVRYTLPNSFDEHVFIDEVQNDIAKYLNGNSNISDGNKKKIMDILYDGSHPSDLLHESFQEYVRGKGWHNRPFAIHSPESKRPISLSDQTGPVPVHYKKTYEEIVKQRFHVEPAKYGERPDETNKTIQGKPIWTGTIRKMEEQELEKMALADVQGTPKKDHYDYSHLLPDHLKNAYTIRVVYHPSTPEYDDKPRIVAQAITKGRELAGSVSGFISGGKIETHQGIKPKHQKQGLGTALLESVLAHAHNAHGVRGVGAAEHTEGATGTHRKVSAKHGLGFESSPTKADKYGQWYEHGGYILKNDDYSDWE